MRDLKLPSVFLFTLAIIASAGSPAYRINCGSSDANATSPDNRPWTGDELGDYFFRGNSPNASFSSKASDPNPSISQVPYLTARVFTAPFTYFFSLSAGPKFVRLFFYPATYSGRNTTDSYFSLVGNNYTLLRNFSAHLNLLSLPNDPSVISKEFYINVHERSQSLSLTFTPNQNSYGFINGIEIVSVPDTLYRNDRVYFKTGNNYIEAVKNDTAMEVVYRFNVGGQDVSVDNDTGMFRYWSQDNSYLHGSTVGLTPHLDLNITYTDATPAYTAPAIVYTTSRTMGREPNENLKTNLTWIFPVHAGFMYIMRLHFCEILQEVVQDNSRVFSIYIDRELTWQIMDVFREAGGREIPIYRDFAVLISDPGGKRGLEDLWLELHPYTKDAPTFADAILNGLEILKVNDAHGSLAGANPNAQLTSVPQQRPGEEGKKGSSIKVIIGCVIGGFLGFVLLCFLIFYRQRQRREKDGDRRSSIKSRESSSVPLTSSSTENDRSSKCTSQQPLPSDICRRFTFAEITTATANFDSKFIVGTGGFGNVYRGYIDEGSIAVAIKRLLPSSKQGAHEFQTEIEMLSKLRHLHLVSLIGYCDENGEMVLVYEYMSRGTLRDHLYATKNPPLSWKKRLEVCIGAARGLQHLHTGAKHSIIHRDVKSTNILLDDNWVAKVSDFGLSRTGPTDDDDDKSHVSTAVKGSMGYVDPEYIRRQQLTEKSDVYSFGVVLLEVLCGRPALVTGLPKDRASLAEWGRQAHKNNMLEQIVDPNLRGQIAVECLRRFVEVAVGCLREEGNDRPAMGDVVWGLDFALQVQVSEEEERGFGSNAPTRIRVDGDMFTQSPTDPFSSLSLRRAIVLGDAGEEGSERRGSVNSVFSEISNRFGR